MPQYYLSSNTLSSEPEFVNFKEAEESIPPAYVTWRAGTSNRVVVLARQAGNRFLGSLKCLKIRALGFIDIVQPSHNALCRSSTAAAEQALPVFVFERLSSGDFKFVVHLLNVLK
jgi:hypothetical protein